MQTLRAQVPSKGGLLLRSSHGNPDQTRLSDFPRKSRNTDLAVSCVSKYLLRQQKMYLRPRSGLIRG